MGFYISKPGPNTQAYLNEIGRHLGEIFHEVYAQDNLIALDKHISFAADPAFNGLLNEAAATEAEKDLGWRLHVACWFARQAIALGGDFVECGVLRGFTSYGLCRHLEFQQYPAKFWLFDTFHGLPDEYSSANERASWNRLYQGAEFADLHAFVKSRFAPFPNVQVVQGMVPEVFSTVALGNIAFLHLDMNAEIAERLALEQLYPHLLPGAVVLLDDYGWSSHREQMLSAKRFFDGKQIPILELPTGQGVAVIPAR